MHITAKARIVIPSKSHVADAVVSEDSYGSEARLLYDCMAWWLVL